MIVTEQLLIDMQACQEGIDWVVQNQVINCTTDEFIKALWDARQSDWYLWAKQTFGTAQFIQQTDHEFFGPYRVCDQEFDTLEQAKQKVQELQQEFNEKYSYLYSVNGHRTAPNGDVTILPCDICMDFAIPCDCYEAFNHETGLYVKFSTYAEARAYALQKKQEREAITNQQFFVEQQVRKIGGTLSAWAKVA